MNCLKKIDATGTSNRKMPEQIRTACTPANIAQVPELICRQDDDPSTNKSPREIQRETDTRRIGGGGQRSGSGGRMWTGGGG